MGYKNDEFGYRLWDPEKKRIVRSRDVVFHKQETMSDSAVPQKTNEPGSKVDLTFVSPPRENAIERAELHEHRVNDEPATNDAGDGGGVEQGEQAPTSQLRRSDREHRPSSRYPSLKFILLTDEKEPKCFENFKLIRIKSKIHA